MATKKETAQAPAPAAPAAPEVKTGELVPAGETALTTGLPDFIPMEATGLEGIGREDVQMPRLAIAQPPSKQLIEGHQLYIEGLRMGQMFNTLTKNIYGKGPLEFIVLRRDNPRWVEFDEDRNMVDPDVHPDDPRTKWRNAENGERLPPIATQFYDYIVYLVKSGETIAMSMSKTNIKAAKKLNGLMKFRIPPVPIYARRFTVAITIETNDKGTYGVFAIETVGDPKVPNSDLVQSRELFNTVKSISEMLQDVVVVIDREGDTDFDTTKFEGKTAAATAASAPGM